MQINYMLRALCVVNIEYTQQFYSVHLREIWKNVLFVGSLLDDDYLF